MNSISPIQPIITAPGIYTLPEDIYHADPIEPFSLSRGIAHLLVTRSPLHAHYAHPKLGLTTGGGIKVNKAMDAGSAVHSMVLEKGAKVVPLAATYDAKHKKAGKPVEDFATNAAKDERDALREAGHIPVLAHELPELRRAAAAVTRNLRWHQDGSDFFGPGQSEAVVVWEEDGLWFRCMVDRLPDDPNAPPYDLKLTGLSAAPGGWERRLRDVYAFQDAFYRRGIAAVRRVMPPSMRFVVGELDAPHGVSVMTPAPSLQAIAEAEVERAIQIWRRCVTDDIWVGYPPFTAHIEATSWQLSQAEEQAMRDEIMEDAQ